MPAVDNLGIRLPIADVVDAIRHRTELKFVAIDAAQAIGHIPLSSDIECSDLAIAGTHKWLGGYLPLGLAFLNNERTRSQIIATNRAMQSDEGLDDPLLAFLTDLETGSLRQHTETVNLTPLLTCCGALHEFDGQECGLEELLHYQLTNAEVVRSLAGAAGWRPLLSASDQRTGIVLMQSEEPAIRSLSVETLRRRMQQSGITATAYEAGIIRLSMPRTELKPEDFNGIRSALQHLSNALVHESVHAGNLLADCVSSAAC
ncbi:MAG: hypothetical protein IAG10_05255 [Planctomycetaceae bacterium]|nr:hypothetical protein [Planctomycetaceae bacterium]